jgi:hypothetical protein
MWYNIVVTRLEVELKTSLCDSINLSYLPLVV